MTTTMVVSTVLMPSLLICMAPPDRIAVIEFPSREAVDAFMADERYQKYRKMREAGSSAQIFLYSNAVVGNGLA